MRVQIYNFVMLKEKKVKKSKIEIVQEERPKYMYNHVFFTFRIFFFMNEIKKEILLIFLFV